MEEQKPITTEECKKAYNHLVEKGYFTEEHIFDFYIDHRDRELIEVLHQMGYDGKLLALGDFYPEYGAFYYVIDSERISKGKAKKIMDNYVANWIKE
ncbi:MAG: hypothetical protein Q3983_02185 [Capnocytophaga sp.]|nr:hypothetical protein [Capnocytophaga sp.]